jgi:hypothetical protein
VKELDERVQKTEMHTALDRLNFSGDYRYEVHSIYEHIPAHYDGMQLQMLSSGQYSASTIPRSDAIPCWL